MNPLYILKMGSTLPEIAAQRGDFEDWICRGLRVSKDDVQVIDVEAGDPLPRADAAAGVVITGSSAMVSDREPWSERAAQWLPTCIAAGTPVLGICYGHQLLAHALGGDVADNPRGREIGTAQVEMSGAWRDDPLLRVLPPKFSAQVTHMQSVIALPDDATLHGASAGDPHQVFVVGERTWGVQFHPEFDADIVRGYIAGRRDVLVSEGLDPEVIGEATRDSGFGEVLLARFAEIAREAASGSG